MLPLPRPGAGRGGRGGRSRTSFATGCWFCVSTISSPGDSLPMSSLNLAWASSTVMVADIRGPPFDSWDVFRGNRVPLWQLYQPHLPRLLADGRLRVLASALASHAG